MNQAWSEYWTNAALVSFSTILILLCLKYFVRLFDILFRAFLRWKQNIELEHNLQLARCRNRAFLILVLPFVLIVDRFDLYRFPLIDKVPPMWSAFACLGIFWIYMLVRQICWLICHPYRMDQEQKLAMHRVFNNLFVGMVPIMLALSGILNFAKVDNNTVRVVLYAVMGFFILMDWVRVCQFLVQHRSRFITFLYLCALEILPLVILMAPVVISQIR